MDPKIPPKYIKSAGSVGEDLWSHPGEVHGGFITPMLLYKTVQLLYAPWEHDS